MEERKKGERREVKKVRRLEGSQGKGIPIWIESQFL